MVVALVTVRATDQMWGGLVGVSGLLLISLAANRCARFIRASRKSVIL
jgi:hypothetical protein